MIRTARDIGFVDNRRNSNAVKKTRYVSFRRRQRYRTSLLRISTTYIGVLYALSPQTALHIKRFSTLLRVGRLPIRSTPAIFAGLISLFVHNNSLITPDHDNVSSVCPTQATGFIGNNVVPSSWIVSLVHTRNRVAYNLRLSN